MQVKNNFGLLFVKNDALYIYRNGHTILAKTKNNIKYLYATSIELDKTLQLLRKYSLSYKRFARDDVIYRINISEKGYSKYRIKNLENFFAVEDNLEKDYSGLLSLIALMATLKINFNVLRVYSMSSLAYYIYKKKFYLKENKLLFKLYEQEDDYLRPSFFGGRCDIIKHLSHTPENIQFYDINSFYPFIMQTYELPVGLPKKIYFLEHRKFSITDFFGFLEISFYLPENLKLGILPLRKKDGPIFPVSGGPYRGTYFYTEVLLALKYGYKITYHTAYSFKKGFLFKEYMEYFYKLKIGTDKNISRLAKNLMNHLYGSFSLYYKNPLRKMTATLKNEEIDTPLNDIVTIREFDNILEITENIHSKPRNVSVSSAISSIGRCLMYDYIYKYNALYFDTDSIALQKPLPEIFLGSSLGLFKSVYNKQIIDYIFISPKFYAFLFEDGNKKLVIKGYSENDFIWDFTSLKKHVILAFKHNSKVQLLKKDGDVINFNLHENFNITSSGVFSKKL